jgi:7-cyano-7-deazaguanine synthase
MTKQKAVLLLSGGLDSATTGAIAKEKGYELYALSFNYGQRHQQELSCAKEVAKMLGVKEHKVAEIDLRLFGGSALTSDALSVPKNRHESDMGHDIPVTYVPARNTIFLSYALGWAEVLGAYDLFIGANHVDYSGYPDCRPEYMQAFEALANLATAAGVEGRGRFRIQRPLITMTKAQIIREGIRLGVDYGRTISCYDPSAEGKPCGACDACVLRAKGFSEAGVDDVALC